MAAGRVRPGAYLVPGIAMVLGAVYLWQTWGYPFDAIALPYTVIALMALFVVIIVTGLVRGNDPGGAEDEGHVTLGQRVRAPLLVALTLLYVGGMQAIGFLFATMLYLGLVMALLGNRRPQIYVPAAILIAGVAFFVLDRLLQISLPSFPYADLPLGI